MCFATPRKVRPPKSPEPQYRTDQGAGLSRPFSFVRRSAMPKRMETGAAVPREASLIVNTHSRQGRRMFREAKELLARSEERRVGKGGVSSGRDRGGPEN